MLLTKKLACPSCSVKLKVADGVPAGKMITCPKCGNGFRLPEGNGYTASPKAAVARPRKAAAPAEEDEDQDEAVAARPRPRKGRKKPQKAANNAPLVLGLVIGGAVSLIVAVVLAVIFRPWEKKAEGVAVNTPARSAATEPGPAGRSGPSGSGPTAQRPVAEPAPSGQASVGAGSDLIATGQRVYQANNCARCHAMGGGGMRGRGPRGPDLSRVGADHTANWLVEQIRDPQSHKPDARMPSYGDKVSEDDLRALASYLASLK